MPAGFPYPESPLLSAFCEQRSAALEPDAQPLELERILRALVERGQRAWPVVAIAPEVFVAHLGGRLPPDLTALAVIHAEDLYLACGCALGLRPAQAALDDRFLCDTPKFLSHFRPAPQLVDEVRQLLRHHLLVGSAERPARIAEYTGRGPLNAWLRIIAVRTALNLQRGVADQVGRRGDDQDLTALADRGPGPEMAYLKTRYAAELNTAFRAALHALPPAQRRLLRMHFIDGLGVERMGAELGVHRSSAARQLQAARKAALSETLSILRGRLRLSESEAESLVAFVRSQLHVSLASALQDPEPIGEEQK